MVLIYNELMQPGKFSLWVFLTNSMTKNDSHFLTLSVEGKNFSRQQLEILSYFPEKIGFDILRKWSHPLFSEKKKKKKKQGQCYQFVVLILPESIKS